MPDFCIPLKQYSKDAIIEIAREAFSSSTEDVANNLNIDSKQVRRIVTNVKAFVPNLSLLINILQLKINIIEPFLENLYNLLQQLPDITKIYFDYFRTIFLFESTFYRFLSLNAETVAISGKECKAFEAAAANYIWQALIFRDTTVFFQKVLKTAVKTYGIPKVLYVYNGDPYTNEQLSLIRYLSF